MDKQYCELSVLQPETVSYTNVQVSWKKRMFKLGSQTYQCHSIIHKGRLTTHKAMSSGQT